MTENIHVQTEDVHKSYRLGKTQVPVLKGVDLSVKRGEWVSLLGASGSGKTSLLNIIGTLERPDKGALIFDGRNHAEFRRAEAVRFRCTHIGFIFQAYHMFPELNIVENVTLPGMLAGRSKRDVKNKALELLTRVGLDHRLKHRPNELSGGEQQRAAIARALINDPELILADEPTGNLDSHTGQGILDIIQELHQSDDGQTIIMVTHDRNVADLADRIVELKDGQIAS